MKKPKAVTSIPGTVETRDATTGDLREVKGMTWNIVPPAKNKCQICAVDHEPHMPHDAGSLYYQVTFHGMHGRSPTWADAIAHCSEGMKDLWINALREKGVWSEPPIGEEPIAHHGIEE